MIPGNFKGAVQLKGDLVLLTVACGQPEYAARLRTKHVIPAIMTLIRHGVALMSNDSSVSTIIYQPSPEKLDKVRCSAKVNQL